MTTLKQVQNMLRLTFGIVPIVAGLDKFTNLLTNWPDYLGTNISSMLPVHATIFMKIVGVIEIAAGIIVLFRPLVGAYIMVMAIGAFTLAKLTMISGSENIEQARAAR